MAIKSTNEISGHRKTDFEITTGSSNTSSSENIPESNLGPGKNERTTYASNGLEKDHYRPIETYEGIHRYDPDFEWEPKEEKKVVRKIDKRIMTWACLMFFSLQLDRSNLAQALSDNMLSDLRLNTNQYNYGQTIFYLCFMCAEMPSQLISKKLGPDNWIPIQMVLWSLVASCQALLSGRNSFFVCRALLGLIEGGFIPDTILYLSYFYTGSELPKRLSVFWTAYQATQIISAFLAYGILRITHNGLEGWRWMFAIEGTITGLIGIATWFYLPASPTQTASPTRWNPFRGTYGWFNEREEKIMVNRILRDDPSKGDMTNRQGLSLTMLWECVKDYHMWPIYMLGLTWLIPVTPMGSYLTLQLRSLGFDTFQTNLLTIPAYVLFIIQLLFWTWVSEKVNQRFLVSLVSQIWNMPVLIALALLPAAASPWARWTLCTLLVGSPYAHAIIVSITSRNAGAVRTRTIASAMYNICVQASSIISTNVYRDDDKPLYRRGNKALIGICAWNMVMFVGAKIYYVQVNKRRDSIWQAMSKEERETYLATTTDSGNKRLDFRFAH
ncbi:MFS general substrate transporter [Dothidotthia symphoricarpi CBS 119687]|uniref:MFS general substrate transporter n=1 Tax=Dothidotthia symphoricarpi CBS 119687 TaxID=1392245 RepID=A0A6A6AJX6_9PLEO|nr:MFS general substrate transporter [Dothidotthia symphoricarpi CBS 119687]KAF2130741.1 MFS general substrate transporter [Dothidotthia symphoricarpi CBS 119687]